MLYIDEKNKHKRSHWIKQVPLRYVRIHCEIQCSERIEENQNANYITIFDWKFAATKLIHQKVDWTFTSSFNGIFNMNSVILLVSF